MQTEPVNTDLITYLLIHEFIWEYTVGKPLLITKKTQAMIKIKIKLMIIMIIIMTKCKCS